MDKKKKKFFSTDVGKVIKGAASVIAPNLVNALEGVGSIGDAINIIRDSNESPEVKLQLEQIALQHEQELTKRLESDNSQEMWLPKLVRPVTLALLVMTYIVGFFLRYDVSVIHAPLMTVFGFYFGGRSLEKLFKKQL